MCEKCTEELLICATAFRREIESDVESGLEELKTPLLHALALEKSLRTSAQAEVQKNLFPAPEQSEETQGQLF